MPKKNNKTKGVDTLIGDPKKAIIKLSIPMIIAMSVQTIYNFADALWVSGFGANIFTSANIAETGVNALAAIGFVFPFFMMAISLSTGLGVGSGSAISRRIGAKDKKGADNVAIHSIILAILLAVVYTIIFLPLSDTIFSGIGAGPAKDMAVSYGQVIFAGSFIVFFINVATAILRGEGDANRAMYAIMLGTILNIFLDPIFIYTFGLGITGAAYATVLSMAISGLLLVYWLFFRKDTYVSFHFKDFKFKKDISFDILKVGFPASIQQFSMSLTMVILTWLITIIDTTTGVAVYTTGWRVVMLAILPLLGMATAVISVTGAAYGAKSYEKLKTSYFYAIKFGLFIEIILAVIIFILAPQISSIFTTAEGANIISGDLEEFIKISCLFYPGAALGIFSSAMFQGTGKGIYSLIATLLRTIIFTIMFVLIFTFVLELGLVGIWWGLVLANLIGSIISFSWGKIFIEKTKQFFIKYENINN